MRKIVALLCTLFFASLCWGQYGKTETTIPTDITPYLASNNAWKLLPGGGVCATNTLSITSYGVPYCLGWSGSSIYGFSYSTITRTWTQLTSMGVNLKQLAPQDPAHFWSLQANAFCNPYGGYQVFSWNGTAWVAKPGCGTDLKVASDGTLVMVNSAQPGYVWKSTDGGSNWNVISGGTYGPNLTYVAASSASVMCGTNGINVFTLVSGHFTQLVHSPANADAGVTGCSIATNTMFAWGPNPVVSVQRYDFGTTNWTYTAAGTGKNSVTTATKGLTLALDSTGHPLHLVVFAPYHSSTISGSWASGCGGPCPPNGVHTATNRSYYPHGLAGNSAVSSGAPGANLNATSFDFTGTCDPFFGDPSDPECQVADVGTVHCSILGSDIFTEANPLPCFLNAVPPNLKLAIPLPLPARGWTSGGPVLVYIKSGDYPSGSTGYTAICNGIKSWAAGNQKTYSCFSTVGVPSPEPTSNYIYVSKGGNRSSTDACGPTPYYSCPTGHIIHHVWMQIDNTATTSQQIQGNAAHEEGHDNFLGDCTTTCQDHGSVMGSGSTDASNQLIAPTNCDIFWYLGYALLWD